MPTLKMNAFNDTKQIILIKTNNRPSDYYQWLYDEIVVVFLFKYKFNEWNKSYFFTLELPL